jgi:hypothetical protein
MSLELIPHDGVDVHMGVAICLPPVGCRSIELMRGKKDLLVIHALGDHEFFSTPLSQSLVSIGSLAYENLVGRVCKNSPSLDGGGGGGGWCCC